MDAEYLATEVVKRLVERGFIAYFAGGWVRDFVMGHPSSDIDIATNAPPEMIVKLFPRSILVGLAFGTVIVVFQGHHFEVSTFRKDIDYVDGRKPTKIELADSAEEDAVRRDFTINGLFYDPLKKELIDFVGGVHDIQQKVIRTIGDPKERFNEDRLRLIRAIRFSCKFQFTIEEETEKAIQEYSPSLFPPVAIERVVKELSKMSEVPYFDEALLKMEKLGLLKVIFPFLSHLPKEEIALRVRYFKRFPLNSPLVFYLLDLFFDKSLFELIEICHYLKLSRKNIDLLEFAFQIRLLLEEEEPDKVALVHFLSDERCDLVLTFLAAHFPEKGAHHFLEKFEKLKKMLQKPIERHKTKTPLISASYLMEHGMTPGVPMGALLAEAERLSIEQEFEKAEEILPLLKESPNWIVVKK
jgi:poly(A) polymerase